jgi:NTP pyrophosphatase (non-canonical NTP hydrolase)
MTFDREKEMTFQDYSNLILPLAKYPSVGNNIVYPLLGLAGEAGEAAEKGKKMWRDYNVTGQKDIDMDWAHGQPEELSALRTGLIKELGDVLWYVTAAAAEIGVSLEEVARTNAEKLLDRKARGVIGGSGDNR